MHPFRAHRVDPQRIPKRRRSGNGGSRCIVSHSPTHLNHITDASLSYLLTSNVVGPVVEAFGYQRILYGSSTSGSDSNNWYEIARESITELGADQEGIDAVFETNATLVYGGA